MLTYDDLLGIFWSAHRCDQINHSRQYMNAVFYHSEAQKASAEASRADAAKARGVSTEGVETGILPVGDFTYAEAYHQKYYLTRYPEIREILTTKYPDGRSLADSSVATRLNAYLGSGMKKDWKEFLKELPEFGLTMDLEEALKKAASGQISE